MSIGDTITIKKVVIIEPYVLLDVDKREELRKARVDSAKPFDIALIRFHAIVSRGESSTVLVFTSMDVALPIIKDIGVTPDHVWLYYQGDSPGYDEEVIDKVTGEITTVHHEAMNRISYNIAKDGRIAISHNFSDSDRNWLIKYLDGANVLILGKMPEDWVEQSD